MGEMGAAKSEKVVEMGSSGIPQKTTPEPLDADNPRGKGHNFATVRREALLANK